MIGAFIHVLGHFSMAAGPAPVGPHKQMGLEDYIADLHADHRSDRLFAARELRRRVRRTTQLANGRPGSLRSEEARNDLLLYDQLLAPACIEVLLSEQELRAPCADILGQLETPTAQQALIRTRQDEKRRWVNRKLDRAIRRVGPSANPGDS